MNKHQPVIERMRDLINKTMGAREYEIQDLLRESSDLLEQYGRALTNIAGTKTNIDGSGKAWGELGRIVRIARDTIEDEMSNLTELLKEWNDPLGANTMSDAEDLIHSLQIELAGKISVIEMLEADKLYMKKIQDELVENRGIE